MRRFFLFFLVAAMLASCSGAPEQTFPTPPVGDVATPAPDSEPTDGETTVISFAAWEYERPIFEPLTKKFMEENPGIKVVLVPAEDLVNVSDPNPDYSPLTQLRRVVSGADTASAFSITPEAFASGLLLDLKPQMDADAAFQVDDFLPGALEQYATNEGTWVLPRYFNLQLLNYNKQLFKDAGLPEPQPGWTWKDLLGVAEQFAQKNGKSVDRYGYLDNSAGFFPMFSLLMDRNINLYTTSAQDVRLDSAPFTESIAQLQGLIDSGAVYRPDYSKGMDAQNDPTALIRDGKVAIWAQDFGGIAACDGPGCVPTPQEYSFEVGKVPFPASDINFFNGGYDGYIISSGTAHPTESWKWIEFLSRQQTDQQPGMMERPMFAPGRVPARLSLAEQTKFWDGLDAQTAAAYRWAIAHPAPPPTKTPDYQVFGPLSQALEQIFGSEKKDPAKALREAQQQLEQQVAEAQLTPTPKPDTSPVVVATPESQEAPEGATVIKFSGQVFNPTDLRRLTRSFRDIRPDIFVQIAATDVFTQPPTLQNTAQTNDCFGWWTPPQTDEEAAAVLDLQPLFDADASFPIDDYAGVLLSPYRRNGALYGLPYAALLRTLNFNRTAFDAAGIATPTYTWSPDDFLAAAQALTKGDGDNKQYGYVALGGPQQDMMFFVNQFGGRLATGSGPSARPTFDDPKTIAAIQWYLDLSKTHKVMPELNFPYRRDEPGVEDKSYEIVQNGRAGMWFDMGYGMFGGGGKGGDGQPHDFEVGIGPLPAGKGGLTSADVYLRGFHISAKTEHADACWEWIKYLSSDVSNLQGSIPARASVRNSDAFIKAATPDMKALTETYAEAFKSSNTATNAGDPNAFYSMDTYWFFKALSEALEGKTPLDQGLVEAQKFTTTYMECLEKQPNKPATCAAQTDPSYQGYNTEDPQEGGPGKPGVVMPAG